MNATSNPQEPVSSTSRNPYLAWGNQVVAMQKQARRDRNMAFGAGMFLGALSYAAFFRR